MFNISVLLFLKLSIGESGKVQTLDAVIPMPYPYIARSIS